MTFTFRQLRLLLFATLTFGALCFPQIASADHHCDITAITAGTQSCGTEVGEFMQEIIVEYENPPASGFIQVELNGSSQFISYPITGSPQSIYLDGLEANGQDFDIFAKFSSVSGCTWNAPNLFTAPEACTAPVARVQVIHNAPDPALETVDVYLTEDFGTDPQTIFFDDVDFKTATPCLPITPGHYILGFARSNSAGVGDVLFSFPFNLREGRKHVLMASGVANPADFDETANPGEIGFTVNARRIGNTNSPAGTVKVFAYHGSPDAPVVDILANDDPFIDDIGYGEFQRIPGVPAAEYKLTVTDASGTTEVASFSADLTGLDGQTAVVFASGFLDPSKNQDGPGFGLCAALLNGHVIDLPVYIDCDISEVALGEYLGCDPHDNTFDQEIIVTYDVEPAAGDILVEVDNSGAYLTFAATGSPQTIVLEDLPANGRHLDVKVKFSEVDNCYYDAHDLIESPRTCRCDITDVTAGDASACDFGDESYDQEIIVEYVNAPVSGYIQVEINGDGHFINYPITGSPQTILLEDLDGNGHEYDIFVKFSDVNNCTWHARDLFRAPNCRNCRITEIEAGHQLNCDDHTDTYDQEIIVTYHDAPTTGDILVYLNDGPAMDFEITGSPQTILLEGLPVGGMDYDVKVNFEDKDCPREEHDVFRSPDGCRCDIVDIDAGHQTECDPHTNTYDQELVITYLNPPSSGHLLVELNDNDHYLEFDITGSPQTILLEDLPSDYKYVDVNVKFSEDRDCRRSEHDVFRAPETCKPKVLNFTLIDAETDMPIAGYDPIPDSSVINLFFLPTDQLSIRANIDPEVVGSVDFDLEGTFDAHRLEEEFPYALFGDINGDYFLPDQVFEEGMSFDLAATPYSRPRREGVEGCSLTIHFSFIHNMPPTAASGSSKDTIEYPVDSIMLCGMGMDADGSIASGIWTKISGPGADIENFLKTEDRIEVDSTFTVDSVFTADTVITMDTITMDSIVVDTTITVDTTYVNDTVVTETVFVDTSYCANATNLHEGTYLFKFTVVDNEGLTDCDTACVVVIGPPPPPGPRVISFTLMDADSDVPIDGYDPIPDGAEIDLAALGGANVNVRANTADGATDAVRSVKFTLSGSDHHSQTENVAPYALFGDNGGNYRPWQPDTPGAGDAYTLSASAYSGGGGSGVTGGPYEISFSFKADNNRVGDSDLNNFTVERSITRSNMLEVFPNPTSDILNLRVIPANDRSLEDAQISMSNGLGQVVFKKSFTEGETHQIQLSNLPAGIYVLAAKGKGYLEIKRVIVE